MARRRLASQGQWSRRCGLTDRGSPDWRPDQLRGCRSLLRLWLPLQLSLCPDLPVCRCLLWNRLLWLPLLRRCCRSRADLRIPSRAGLLSGPGLSHPCCLLSTACLSDARRLSSGSCLSESARCVSSARVSAERRPVPTPCPRRLCAAVPSAGDLDRLDQWSPGSPTSAGDTTGRVLTGHLLKCKRRLVCHEPKSVAGEVNILSAVLSLMA